MHQSSGRSPELDELMCYLALFLDEEKRGLLHQPSTGEQTTATASAGDPGDVSREQGLLLHPYLDRVQAQALAPGSIPRRHQQQHLSGKWLAAGAAQRDSP